MCVCVFLLEREGKEEGEDENEEIRYFWFKYLGGERVAGLRVVSRVLPGNSRIDPYQLFTSRFISRCLYISNLRAFTNLTSTYL